MEVVGGPFFRFVFLHISSNMHYYLLHCVCLQIYIDILDIRKD